MTLTLGRSAVANLQRRLSTYSRRHSEAFTQQGPRLKPMQRGGRNLGLRYQQLESSVRSTARKVALLDEMTGASCLVEQRNFLPVADESQTPREKVEMFHGLVVPREPKPPESDGEFFTLFVHLELDLEGTCTQNVACLDVRSAFTTSTKILS